MSNIFFVIGSGRSGTTAMVEILRTGKDVRVYAEDNPKLCIASRMHYEGMLPYAKEFITKSKHERIREVLKKGKIYGDKNPNYLHFVQEISELWDCKFLFLIRDGRDVVRSCMDFHPARGPGYGRYEDDEESMMTQPEDNFWDFSRIRPKKTSPEHKVWRMMTPFQKFAWGWADFNRILSEKAEKLDPSRYRWIDMTKMQAEDIKDIFRFLGLEGFDMQKVELLLRSRVNATILEESNCFPAWPEWDKELLGTFDKYAGKMMKQLGYYA
jgi:hypothetical protein